MKKTFIFLAALLLASIQAFAASKTEEKLMNRVRTFTRIRITLPRLRLLKKSSPQTQKIQTR